VREIICRLTDDEFTIEKEYMNFNINDNKIFTYTFWNNILRMPIFISNVGLDLLYISLFVYGVDRVVSRKETIDNWTRKIKLYIPVLEVDRWNKNKELFIRLLNFLSGDRWDIEFRKREILNYEKMYMDKIKNSNETKKIYDEICMFSGGLDSFIGAIDLLETDNKNRLFLSHYGGGKGTKEFQDILREQLINNYDLESRDFYSFYAAAKNGVEDTTRTRSFMFFAHAIALATCMNKLISLVIPENGLISLNIPLTYSRLGSSSTRTTHPYYLDLLQKLLKNMGFDLRIINPYQFFTKGEMIINCKNQEFLIENLHNTMSCSHPDYGRMQKETEACHCGYCLPCVIRRAATKRANIIDITRYRDNNFSSGETSRINFNSYLLGIEKFDEERAFLDIQKSGPILNNIKKFSDLYIRGMHELKEFLGEFYEFV